jgi:CMP-N-acetylneuraminic acid synthetase
MRVLGLVPARGGSKGIPRKNLAPLLGRPLLAYTARAALEARRLDRVVLSTDDPEIARVGAGCGLEVPFMRPPELARDSTPSALVLRHALEMLESDGDLFDAVCLLQPTSPLRRAADIDACIDLFAAADADTVVTVLPVPDKYNPHWVFFSGPGGRICLATGGSEPIPRRQDLPPAYHRDGSVYVVRAALARQGRIFGERTFACVMSAAESVNIDHPSDLERAARLLEKGALLP